MIRTSAPLTLLFFGSLSVSVGVIVWAAIEWAMYGDFAFPRPLEPVAPVYRFVNAGSNDRSGGSSSAVVWQTSTSPGDCAEVIDRRKREEKKRVADLLNAETLDSPNRAGKNPCALFQLGEVEEGTRVQVLGKCGRMAKVRILSGGLRSREGCIPTERLSTDGGPRFDGALKEAAARAGSAIPRPRSPRPR